MGPVRAGNVDCNAPLGGKQVSSRKRLTFEARGMRTEITLANRFVFGIKPSVPGHRRFTIR